MEISRRSFYVGQCVFAKIKGSPPWPGIVVDIDKSRAKVVYFNWHNQYNWVGFKKLTTISGSNQIVSRYYERNVAFRTAVDEMKLILNGVVQDRQNNLGTISKVPDHIDQQNKLVRIFVDIYEYNFDLFLFYQPKQLFVRLQRITPQEIKMIQKSLKKNKKKYHIQSKYL